MSAPRLDSRELLEYNARYRVLICRECQYAIQKSALGSHLLRHKIFRGERESLLDSITQLNLLEAHLVPLPSSTSPPINGLSIVPGYRCAATGCGNLCASIKRMRRHWSEIHGFSQPLPDSSVFACPVTLQTFFRGTKLKYFEVTVPATAGAHGYKEPRNDGPESQELESDDQELHTRNSDTFAQLTSTTLAERVHPLSGIALEPSLVDFDLQTLTYLHNFITSTSLSLPSTEYTRPGAQYWQTDVVLQALQTRWLMCGLMAISACHMAALANDTMTKRLHHERSANFFSRFSAAWNEIVTRGSQVLDVEIEEEEQPAKRVGRQLLSQLRCAYWSLAESNLGPRTVIGSVDPFEIQSLITTIRDFLVPEFTFRPDATRVDDDGGEMFAQAKRILELKGSLDIESSGNSSSTNNTSSALRLVLNLLSELPSRMAETFTKPQNGPDFLATMSAIAALIKCCNISFASEDVEGAWWGMSTWLIKIPGHFNTMLACYHPPAMVVLAHWAALLVRRAEHCDTWFLKGLSNRILLQVTEQIPTRETAVHSMLEKLIT
ncbi:hypothetical protein PVAG01_11486 [Phlyctema vagabunda]|uniref:C2H2-type domain-containing protein n=1 Tax=Phlyctema vagabunda TaxID=108571 RepID=A0ABR4P170_9HELO